MRSAPREITGGAGVDRVVDIVGGDTTARLIDAMARGGHLVLVSTLAGRDADLPLGKILGNWLTVSGSTLRPQSSETKAAIAMHLRRHLWPAFADPALPHPRIQRFPLAEAAAAHRAMEDRQHYGKIVLLTDFGARSGNR